MSQSDEFNRLILQRMKAAYAAAGQSFGPAEEQATQDVDFRRIGVDAARVAYDLRKHLLAGDGRGQMAFMLDAQTRMAATMDASAELLDILKEQNFRTPNGGVYGRCSRGAWAAFVKRLGIPEADAMTDPSEVDNAVVIVQGHAMRFRFGTEQGAPPDLITAYRA